MRKLLTTMAAACGLFCITAPLAAQVAAAQTPTPRVTVRSGDTLWGIGIRTHRTWPQLASYNHIPNPDLIMVGQVITIPPASYVAAPVPTPAPTPTYTPPPVHVTYTQHVTYTPPAPAPVSRPSYQPAYGGYQACVAQRESGNGSGSSDIYGFLPSTWASLGLGGSPYTASRSQQDAAFQQLYARSGTAPWSPYDGC